MMVSACHYTMPMYLLWKIVFIANLVIVFAIIPFTLFFYEADSDLWVSPSGGREEEG